MNPPDDDSSARATHQRERKKKQIRDVLSRIKAGDFDINEEDVEMLKERSIKTRDIRLYVEVDDLLDEAQTVKTEPEEAPAAPAPGVKTEPPVKAEAPIHQVPPLPRPVAPQAEARSIAPAHPPRQQPSTPKRRHTIPACLDSDDSDAPPRPPKRARRPREHIYLRSATPSGSTPQAGSSARGSSSAASRLVPGTSRSSPSTEPEEPAARQQVQEEDIKPVVQEPQEPEREALTRVLGGSDMLDWLGNAVSADLTRHIGLLNEKGGVPPPPAVTRDRYGLDKNNRYMLPSVDNAQRYVWDALNIMQPL